MRNFLPKENIVSSRIKLDSIGLHPISSSYNSPESIASHVVQPSGHTYRLTYSHPHTVHGFINR